MQTCLATIAIDRMASFLMPGGRFSRALLMSVNNDSGLLDELYPQAIPVAAAAAAAAAALSVTPPPAAPAPPASAAFALPWALAPPWAAPLPMPPAVALRS